MTTVTTKNNSKRRRKTVGGYNEDRICERLQVRIKKKFGYTPRLSQIKKVWRDYMKDVSESLNTGKIVKLDKKNKLFVMGERIQEGTVAHKLLKQGRTLSRNKVVKIKKINARHLGIKYKIEFEHTGNVRDDVYFIADRKLSLGVHRALMNTQVNYSIKP